LSGGSRSDRGQPHDPLPWLQWRCPFDLQYVTHKGIEYKGRHQPIISERLFDTAQRVLDSRQGSGVRERSHHHYLKGWLWCNRCSKRFVVQRTLGRRGGEYYYFFCMGRQEGTCDHPYVPVEEMEKQSSTSTRLARGCRTSSWAKCEPVSMQPLPKT